MKVKTKILLIILAAASSVGIASCTKSKAAPQPNAVSGATEQTTKQQAKSNYSYRKPDNFVEYEDSPNLATAVAVVKQWDQFHNRHTTSGIDKIYEPVCLYYGTDEPLDYITQSKSRFFAKHPQYQQYIDHLEIIDWGSSHVVVCFAKHVRTSPDSNWQTYQAYLRLIGGPDEWGISWESDKTTDANLKRRSEQKPPSVLQITNSTPLSAIFNDQNVGKVIDVDYWELVGTDGDLNEGPLAAAISDCHTIGARNTIEGPLRKGYRGDKNTLYVGGTCSGGPFTTRVLWIYDKTKRKLRVYPEF